MLRMKISEEDFQVAKIERYLNHPPRILKQLSILAMSDYSGQPVPPIPAQPVPLLVVFQGT